MSMVDAEATNVHEAITARLHELLGNAESTVTARALTHLEYLWSEGAQGTYLGDVHSVVWAAVTDTYMLRQITSLSSVPRMLRGAAAQTLGYYPVTSS
jgi:hypothetical protein